MSCQPRIHCICIIKNERDIIEYVLKQMSIWAYRIYVYDNGSTDGTWESVQALAQRNSKIIGWKSVDKPYRDEIRSEVFNAFRENARDGDWWCKADADEFYIQDPRKYLAAVPRRYQLVFGLAIEYYLTHADVASIDFSLPIEERLPLLRHYRAENCEQRFFRHRDRLVWPGHSSWPIHMGLAHPELIYYKHYKYRSPQQIQQRLDVRRQAVASGYQSWGHANQQHFEEKIVDGSDLHIDRGDGRWQINLDRMQKHFGAVQSRLVKRFMHGLGIWP